MSEEVREFEDIDRVVRAMVLGINDMSNHTLTDNEKSYIYLKALEIEECHHLESIISRMVNEIKERIEYERSISKSIRA